MCMMEGAKRTDSVLVRLVLFSFPGSSRLQYTHVLSQKVGDGVLTVSLMSFITVVSSSIPYDASHSGLNLFNL